MKNIFLTFISLFTLSLLIGQNCPNVDDLLQSSNGFGSSNGEISPICGNLPLNVNELSSSVVLITTNDIPTFDATDLTNYNSNFNWTDYLGSGVLVMDKYGSGVPYIWTAAHIFSNWTPENLVFHFNYDNINCPTLQNPTPTFILSNDYFSLSGSELVWSEYDIQNPNITIDLALLRITDYPESNSNIFYSGWDFSVPFSNYSLPIFKFHHPKGDSKKYLDGMITQIYAMSNVIETGNWLPQNQYPQNISSGSPIFQNDKVIGIQDEGCTTNNNWDLSRIIQNSNLLVQNSNQLNEIFSSTSIDGSNNSPDIIGYNDVNGFHIYTKNPQIKIRYRYDYHVGWLDFDEADCNNNTPSSQSSSSNVHYYNYCNFDQFFSNGDFVEIKIEYADDPSTFINTCFTNYGVNCSQFYPQVEDLDPNLLYNYYSNSLTEQDFIEIGPNDDIDLEWDQYTPQIASSQDNVIYRVHVYKADLFIAADGDAFAPNAGIALQNFDFTNGFLPDSQIGVNENYVDDFLVFNKTSTTNTIKFEDLIANDNSDGCSENPLPYTLYLWSVKCYYDENTSEPDNEIFAFSDIGVFVTRDMCADGSERVVLSQNPQSPISINAYENCNGNTFMPVFDITSNENFSIIALIEENNNTIGQVSLDESYTYPIQLNLPFANTSEVTITFIGESDSNCSIYDLITLYGTNCDQNASCSHPNNIVLNESGNTLQLSWDAVANATSYEVCLSYDGITIAACYTTPTHSLDINGFSNCASGFIKIKAICNSTNDSQYSPYHAFVFPSTSSNCQAPISINSEGYNTSALLSWLEPSAGDAPEFYEIRYQTTAFTWSIISVSANNLLVILAGLNSCSIYNFQIRSICDCDASSWSTVYQIETTGCTPPTCNDGVQNGNETGVDCGGTNCAACTPGVCDDFTIWRPYSWDCGNLFGIQGDIKTIEWTGMASACGTSLVNVEYSTDAGNTWNIQALNQPNNGIYSFTLLYDHASDSLKFKVSCSDGSVCSETCNYRVVGFSIPGCTDPSAHNYDPDANFNYGCETCFDGILNEDELGIDCGGTNPNCVPCTSTISFETSPDCNTIYEVTEDMEFEINKNGNLCDEMVIEFSIDGGQTWISNHSWTPSVSWNDAIEDYTFDINNIEYLGTVILRFTCYDNPQNQLVTCPYTITSCGGPIEPYTDPCFAISASVDQNCNFNTYDLCNLTLSNYDFPTCFTPDYGEIWYSVVVPNSGKIVVETQVNTGYVNGGRVFLYNGTCDNLVRLTDCMSSDVSANNSNQLFQNLLPGSTVYFRYAIPGALLTTATSSSFDICFYEPETCVADQIIFPSNATVSCSDELLDLNITGDVNGETTLCPTCNEATFVDQTNYDVCNGGSVIRTWSFTDNCGTEIMHDQLITIQTNSFIPQFNEPSNTTINCDEDFTNLALTGEISNVQTICGSFTSSYVDDLSNIDNCTGAGQIIRTWKVTSTCGQENTKTQTIQILENNCGSYDCNGDCNGSITIGASCDDGNNCTTNDIYDNNCNCQGTLQDADGDGICDTNDVCPNFDDNLIGSSCDDGNNCTTNDMYNNICNCEGTFLDTDSDGICDEDDACPNFNDNLIGSSCDDGNNCTTNDIYNNNCNCEGTFQDADGDGVCDANDVCQNFDDNIIGQSCNDNNPNTTNDIYQTNCICEGQVLNNCNSLNLTLNITNETCFESEDGSIGLTIMGGNAPYTIFWSNNSSTSTINNLSSGVYSVTVSDSQNCMANESAAITSLNILSSSSNVVQASSSNSNDGSITLNALGGTAPYTYLWSNGQTTASVYNLSTGNYWVTVTDANGCSFTDSFNITNSQSNCDVPQNINYAASINSISLSWDIPPYIVNNYLIEYRQIGLNNWTQTTTSNFFVTLNNLQNCTTYEVRIKSNCIGQTSNYSSILYIVTFEDSDNDSVCNSEDQCPNFDDNLINTACDDGNNLTLNDAWTMDCLCAGELSISGCTSSTACNYNPNALNDDGSCLYIGDACNDFNPNTLMDAINQNCACIGIENQCIEDTLDFSNTDVEWVANSSADIFNNGAIEFTIKVNDPHNIFVNSTEFGNGIEFGIDPINLSESIDITYSFSENVDFAQFILKDLDLKYIGSIAKQQEAATITGFINNDSVAILPTITNLNGNVSIQGNYLEATTASTANNDESVLVTFNDCISGFIVNYGSGDDFTIPDPDYSKIQIGDEIGLIASNCNCNSCDSLNIVSTFYNESCYNASDGSIEIDITGGHPPYTIDWHDNESGVLQLNNLNEDDYFVTISDNENCSLTDTISIIGVDNPLTVSATITSASNINFSDGAIDLNTFGGTPPYNYFWTNGTNTEDLISLSIGTYWVIVTDANNCSVMDSYSIVVEACDPPINIISTSSNNGLAVFWDAPINGANAYSFEYSLVGSSVWNSVNTANPFLAIYNLASCSDYEFRIKSDCGQQTSNFTSTTIISTLDCNCPVFISEMNNILIPSGNYNASDYIESNGSIVSGENVMYEAANYIDLQNDFEVIIGAEFEALIGVCNP